MSRCFRIYLISLAVASALVVALPALVMLGLVLGIVPGILLALAPTLLMYSLSWWLLRAATLWGAARLGANPARPLWRQPAGFLAALVLFIPVTLLPEILNRGDHAASRMLRSQDKDAVGPLSLPGTILYRANDTYDREAEACDDVCLRLLYNGAVKKVVVAYACAACSPPRQNPPLAFWIERRDYCGEFQKYGSRDLVFPMDSKAAGYGMHYVLRARLAAGECVVHGPGDPSEAALTLSFNEPLERGVSIYSCQWCLTESFVQARRLEFIGNGDVLLYRRTEVEYRPLVTPLHISVASSFMTSVNYAGWSRETRTDTPIGPLGRDVLGDLLGAAVRVPDMPAAE